MSDLCMMMVFNLSINSDMVLIRVGPSGLVTARELRKEGYRVVVLEKNHDVGGQWLYQANVEEEDHLGRKPFLKVHNNIYESIYL